MQEELCRSQAALEAAQLTVSEQRIALEGREERYHSDLQQLATEQDQLRNDLAAWEAAEPERTNARLCLARADDLKVRKTL